MFAILSFLVRLVLAATAIVPIGFIYGFVAIFQSQQKIACFSLLISCFLVCACWVFLRFIEKSPRAGSTEKHKITTVEPADRENIAIILFYLAPLFTSDISKINWEIWFIAIITFLFIEMTSHSYFFNPLLNMLGWHFYRVGTPEGVTRILISRKTLNRGGGEIAGIQLSAYVIWDNQ